MHTTKKQKLNLLRALVVSDFKIRYQGSVLGYLWSLVRPLSLFTVLYVVFDKVFGFGAGIPHYPAYLLLGIMLWTFFVESTNMAMTSIIDRGGLIRKVNISKFIILSSAVLSALINLTINLSIVLLFLLISRTPFTLLSISVVVFIVELVVFSIACALVLASLFAKYRDIKFIWELVLQILFYATPIIYPLSVSGIKIPPAFINVISLSPLTQIIQDARYAIVTKETKTVWVYLHGYTRLVPIVIILLTGLLGIVLFRARAKYFAEEV